MNKVSADNIAERVLALLIFYRRAVDAVINAMKLPIYQNQPSGKPTMRFRDRAVFKSAGNQPDLY